MLNSELKIHCISFKIQLFEEQVGEGEGTCVLIAKSLGQICNRQEKGKVGGTGTAHERKPLYHRVRECTEFIACRKCSYYTD